MKFLLANAADNHGCGYHRIVAPARSLAAHGVATTRVVNFSSWPEPAILMARPDAVVWQRQIELGQIEHMERLKKALPSVPFVFETDDLLTDVPAVNWHADHMPPAGMIEERLRTVLRLCDFTSTTTSELAEWLSGYGAKNVHVIENFAPRAVEAWPMSYERRPGGPLAKALGVEGDSLGGQIRIGWGGSRSHGGDIKLITEAVKRLSENGANVHWVFVGMRPEGDLGEAEKHLTFLPGTPPEQYLDALAHMRLDLVLAPLEDHFFNRAKSDLRLVEAGAIGAPVVASMVGPYARAVDEGCPMFGGLGGDENSPEGWYRLLSDILSAPDLRKKLRDCAKLTRKWVVEKKTMEGNLTRRAEAWGLGDWVAPRASRKRPMEGAQPIISGDQRAVRDYGSSAGESIGDLAKEGAWEGTLRSAWERARDEGRPVLWVRPGTELSRRAVRALRRAAPVGGIACAVSNDAAGLLGAVGWPQAHGWQPMTTEQGRAAGAALEWALGEGAASAPAAGWAFGPATWFDAELVRKSEAPSEGMEVYGECEELAILTWSWGARTARGAKIVCALKAWATARAQALQVWPQMAMPMNEWTMRAQVRMGDEVQAERNKLLAIISVKESEAAEEAWLKKTHKLPIPAGGGAGNADAFGLWSALFHGPHGEGASAKTKKYAVVPYGAKVPEGVEWVIFLSGAVQLEPGAEERLVEVGEEAGADFVYSDHQVLVAKGAFMPGGSGPGNPQTQQVSLRPFFKPHTLDHEFLLARDYATQVSAWRVGERVRAGEVEFHDWVDAWRYLVELGANMKIAHCDEILATVMLGQDGDGAEGTSAAKLEQRREIIRRVMGRDSESATPEILTVFAWTELKGALSVRHAPREAGLPADITDRVITIIIPTKGDAWLLRPCVASLRGKTRWRGSWEVKVVLALTKAPTLEGEEDTLVADVNAMLAEEWTKPQQDGDPISLPGVVLWEEEFNWSRINNRLIERYVDDDGFAVLLNDDTRIESEEWLEELVCAAGANAIAGAKLIFPSGHVQHVGVACSGGLAAHPQGGIPAQEPGYWGQAVLGHEAYAVTGAAMAFAKKVWRDVGGFREDFPLNYNDVLFCVDARAKGYRSIVATRACLQHLTGQSRGGQQGAIEQLLADTAHLKEVHKASDPYWNRNFQLDFGPDGISIVGHNYDRLNWERWMPGVDKPGVLLINPQIPILVNEVRKGNRVWIAQAGDFGVSLSNPQRSVGKGWDVRRVDEIQKGLDRLGIETVVLGGLVAGDGRPVAVREMLAALGALGAGGITVAWGGSEVEKGCPRGNAVKGDGQMCGHAWREESSRTCDECLGQWGCAFGAGLGIDEWRSWWAVLSAFAAQTAVLEEV